MVRQFSIAESLLTGSHESKQRSKLFETGLLIAHQGAKVDTVLRLVPTPNAEEGKEATALDSVRALASGGGGLDAALDAVMAYWAQLNWTEETSEIQRRITMAKQRTVYERTLGDRPWETCSCRVCREIGVEALIFRNSNRNKRRGMHNLHVFHEHLKTFRTNAE